MKKSISERITDEQLRLMNDVSLAMLYECSRENIRQIRDKRGISTQYYDILKEQRIKVSKPTMTIEEHAKAWNVSYRHAGHLLQKYKLPYSEKGNGAKFKPAFNRKYPYHEIENWLTITSRELADKWKISQMSANTKIWRVRRGMINPHV
jgi:hypothetical protein